jgi:hypothetical protein
LVTAVMRVLLKRRICVVERRVMIAKWELASRRA